MTQAFNDSWSDQPDPGFVNDDYRYHRGGRVLLVCQRCGCMVPVKSVPMHDGWHSSFDFVGEFIGEGEIVSDEDAIITDQPSITDAEKRE